MNGLPAIANNLAAQGRGPDQMLVHMSPREVGGLQALAQANGGSLTTNPSTGLPEAGFLDSLLPTVLGFGASMLFPAASPWLIGGGIGALQGIRKKDLGAGLMAGLGAFGGAGLGQALTSAGAQAAMSGEVAKQAAGTSAAQMGTQAGADAILQAGARPDTFMGNLQMAGKGVSSLAEPGGFSNLGTGLQQAFPSTAAKTAATLGASTLIPPPEPLKTPESEDPYANYKGPYTPTKRRVSYPGQLDSSEYMYFDPSNPVPYAKGGSVPMLEDGGFVLTKKAVDGLGKGDQKKGQAVAQAGLGAIPIKGKGTGTSDSIRTSIDGKVPAKVSNGEAYVPKANVEKVGGAKKLYALMRKAERRG